LGPEGTSVRLTLEREGQGQFEVTLQREPVANALIEIRVLPGRVGYIRVRSFPSSIARLTDEGVFSNLLDGSLARLQNEGATGWILDLRNNSGGDVRAASQLTGRFTPQGPYAFTLSRFNRSFQLNEGPRIAGVKALAVLVNEGSYSAAELTAAVMQEYQVAQVFGAKSPGIVDGAQTFDLADGAGISITTARILTGQGRRSLEGVGVTPDQIVPITRADLAAGRDPQLDAALSYVRSQVGP
jgi:carboxyl-terminal processing protease